MKWTQTKNVIYMKDYPFFNTVIFVRKNGNTIQYAPNMVRGIYLSLHDAKQAVINHFVCKQEVSSFDEIKWHIGISMGYPNNIGNGFYINCKKNYNWVLGAWQPWRCPNNSYAIRFDINTTQEQLEKYAVKIYNRHLKRLKEQSGL